MRISDWSSDVCSSDLFEIFEAVAGDQDRFARLVEPVVGAADALEEARAALGRPHLHDEVDIAPVDAEIEAGGTDEAAKPPLRHRLLDLAPDRKSTRLNSSH